MKNNQKGFSAVEVLLVLVILGLIGLAGWFVFNRNADKNETQPKTFSSYDDCAKNDGKILEAEFSACTDDKHLYLQYSAQNLPRLSERKNSEKENKVEYSGNYSSDLIAFLRQDFTGCDTTGYYKILKEVPGRFAQMNYGCDGANNDKTYIIAMKLADGWSLISPTNHMNEQGVPSCLMVDMFKISKNLSDTCFENTGFNNGNLRKVEYL